MPTQRTIYSTLEDVERRLVDEGVRPPAVVVIGGVVTIAAELAALAREAHEQICPYSHATRNNVPMELEIKGA